MEEVFRGFHVFGKVQGVFFRQSTRVEAERLKVRGTARNLRDGTVQVVAYGAADPLDTLRAWLEHGPVHARVDAVEDFEPNAELRGDLPEVFEVR